MGGGGCGGWVGRCAMALGSDASARLCELKNLLQQAVVPLEQL